MRREINLESYLTNILEGVSISGDRVYYEIEDEETEDCITKSLPVHIALCDNCDGKGHHLRTSLRDIAFSSEDEDYDPDFMEEMRNDEYDECCEECDGSGRIYVIDEKNLNFKEQKEYNRIEQEAHDCAQDARDDAYTRRMESGGY